MWCYNWLGWLTLRVLVLWSQISSTDTSLWDLVCSRHTSTVSRHKSQRLEVSESWMTAYIPIMWERLHSFQPSTWSLWKTYMCMAIIIRASVDIITKPYLLRFPVTKKSWVWLFILCDQWHLVAEKAPNWAWSGLQESFRNCSVYRIDRKVSKNISATSQLQTLNATRMQKLQSGGQIQSYKKHNSAATSQAPGPSQLSCYCCLGNHKATECRYKEVTCMPLL